MIVPPPRHTRLRVLAAFATAAALAIGIGVGAPASAATTPTPTPTSSPGVVDVTLSPIRDGILRAGDGLTVSVGIENGTDAATPPTTVTLSLGRGALASRAELASWLDGTTDGPAVEAIGTATLEPVAPGEQDFTGILVPADAPALAGLAPGVYPIVASYDSAEGPMSSTSVVVVPRDDPRAGIGIVVPITAAPRSEALLTAQELTELTADGGALEDALDAVQGTTAILGIDPAILAAIRVLGVSAPESAVAWLERLAGLPNARFALQFGDADPAVQVEAGGSPHTPTSLAAFLNAADFPPVTPDDEPAATPTPSPSPSVDPLAPSFPALDALLDVSATRGAVYWPSADSVTPGAVESLGALGTDEDGSLTLVPSTATDAGAGGSAVSAHASAGDAGLLVYDADMSRELSEAAARAEGPIRGASLAAASAYLSFASAEAGDGVVLAALDRSTSASQVSLRAAIEAASDYPDVTATSFATIIDGAPQALRIADAEPPAERVSEASSLFSEEAEIARFATILDDPALLTGPERAEILQLLGVGWDAEPEAWAAAVAEHHQATRTTLGSVRLLPTTTINLVGSAAALKFTVRNDLPYPVNLVLYATPDDLRLDVQRANPVVATAASNTRVEVPVGARLGNGEVTLTLQLRSRASVAIGPVETVDVNVRAEWETFGIVALSVVVGGLLVLGVVRTVRRARARRRKGMDAGAPASAESRPDQGSDS
ncbi:hypothetical protein GCM10009775_12680 [Microbacterium aoyamense]|uniref:2-oxoglutarate dehydrogenase n=1 Tax=Microbacterium aoyamense TaxID=344166 RepID=A0ABP5AST6_9MICO|nr:DUF6049 family protein [Microbacterium aoyamense]